MAIGVKKIIGNYRIEKTIGEGTFGKVKLGIHIPTDEKVAIKILEKDKIQDKEDLERIRREIHFLKKLNHPNIIRIYDLIENTKIFYIIMEFASCGELFTRIVTKKKLDEEEASYYYVQLISGLEIIHKHKIVHRDIKPENLLLKENNILTIIDFGLSNQYKRGELLSTPCGSPCYAAPEMLLGKKYNGLMVDLWSSGIVLYAMVCGYLPFEDKNNDKLYKKILNGHFELPEYLSQDCKDLLLKILVVNPTKRYSLEKIKAHPFLKEAFQKYHLDEYEDSSKFCEPVIDKMINGMPGFNFKRDEIIYNLTHNRHNTITTTYALLLKKFKLHKTLVTSGSGFNDTVATDSQQSISLNTTTSPVKLEEDKMNINILRTSNPKNTNHPNKKAIVTSRKSKYSRHHNNTLNQNLNCNKTIDSYKNFSTYSNPAAKGNYKGTDSKNDISVSLDVSKIISKNKIDSNVIICMPKLVPINKKIFSNFISKPNKFYYKTTTLNNEFRKNYNKYSNQPLFSNRKNNSNKNNTVNTSITYENSPCRLYNNSREWSKNKKMVYVASNTINLLDDDISLSNKNAGDISNKKNKKRVRHYPSYNRNAQPSSFKSLNLNVNNNYHCSKNELYARSLSVNGQKLQSFNYSQSSIYHYHSNSAQKYLMTATLLDNAGKESNYNISTSSISTNKKIIATNNSEISKNSSIKTPHKNVSIISNQKNKNIAGKFKKDISSNKPINSKKTKCSSPNSQKVNIESRSNYCPSFTDSTSPTNLDKVLFENISKLSNLSAGINNNNLFAKSKIINKVQAQNIKQSEIYITIKNDTVKNVKKDSKCRPITPRMQKKKIEKSFNTQKNSHLNEKKDIKAKPTVVNIDITEEPTLISAKAKKNEVKKTSASSSQKSIKSVKVPSNVLKQKAISKQKKKYVNTKDIGVIDLSNNDCLNKKQKKQKIHKINPPEIQFDLEDDTETKNKIISSSKDFALCTTTLNQGQINEKLIRLCKENGLTLTEIDKMKYICKKDSDNSINIEVSTVGGNTVLKLYHLNGQESITKEMIKKIIITIGF